jgi:dTDP-4-dehydrorhamnose 3,5-epimerase
MHWQAEPYTETKLVRCCRGAIYDVVLDMRAGLPTFGRWIAVELSDQDDAALYVPVGCAHGFQTLHPDSWVSYQIHGTHSPEASRGVRWDDPRFNIVWPPCEQRLISDRDANFIDFCD